MALITCPECGRQVSERAKACPGCGCPIAEAETHNGEIYESQKTIEETESDKEIDNLSQGKAGNISIIQNGIKNRKEQMNNIDKTILRKCIIVVITLIGLFLLFAIFVSKSTDAPTSHEHTVENEASNEIVIPDVIGLDTENAREELEAKGLEVIVEGPDINGVVIHQDPTGVVASPTDGKKISVILETEIMEAELIEDSEDTSGAMLEGYFYDPAVQNDYLPDFSDIYIGMPFEECYRILSQRQIIMGNVQKMEIGNRAQYATNLCSNGIAYMEILTETTGFGGESENLRAIRFSYYMDDKEQGKNVFDSIVDYYNTTGGDNYSSEEDTEHVIEKFKFGGYTAEVKYSLFHLYWENQSVSESSYFKLMIGGPLWVTLSDYDGRWGSQ